MPILENLKKQFDQFVNTSKDDNEEDFIPCTEHLQISNPPYFHANAETVAKQTLSPNTPVPFADIYKTAYTHGLEKTYALETVNVNSIRKLNTSTPTKISSSVSETVSEVTIHEKQQLEFDFGPGFRNWISPIFLDEPIHILGLSQHAEKCLEKNGKCLIQDLLKADTQDLIFLKGMGQGHIDEIQQTLKKYVKNRSTERDYSLGWGSWIKSLVGAYDRKKSYVFLEKFDLNELLSLSPAENVEVRRLNTQKKEEWYLDVKKFCTSPAKSESVHQRMQEVVEAFIKPWMQNRSGIATLQELKERFQKISYSFKIAHSASNFFNELFYDNQFCLATYLHEVGQGLFCVDQRTAEIYLHLTKKARSYFYSPKTNYKLDHLIQLLEKEEMKEWNHYARHDMQKMLRLSPFFSVRKGMSHQLEIRLN
ncbi:MULTISPECIES: DNA-directed RNA polymerase subunit alpha C-terminal domain-containing protein [Parachlamydia]|uniref:RNA polymerase alpha subunit C-terminal domain-containing protein n=2 Tax=Parachlamydia acanthamoebae TaxID=83552 RepID=F8KWU0_PARAV|nr:DNA-directed RNA polymerase subunit alpha C-terminal domain-containing protein [Parachlamydia acanthamoebae]EFB42409.1 hypothetical protein pah_c008o015 [Parachlamydia acanthamoebae str. Hall's coccus]CCB86390.1 putative uncharacterized protein [Parachlamydia acanthamoebae UV-7]